MYNEGSLSKECQLMYTNFSGSALRTTAVLFWTATAAIVAFATFAVLRTNTPTLPRAPAAAPANMPAKPDWLAAAPVNVQESYQWAAANHEALQYIPCYCGCHIEHASNSACYFTRDQTGAIVAYDMHAVG